LEIILVVQNNLTCIHSKHTVGTFRIEIGLSQSAYSQSALNSAHFS